VIFSSGALFLQLALSLCAASESVEIKVYDLAKKPIPGAKVKIQHPDNSDELASGKTDAKGTFKSKAIDSRFQRILIVASADGKETSHDEVGREKSHKVYLKPMDLRPRDPAIDPALRPGNNGPPGPSHSSGAAPAQTAAKSCTKWFWSWECVKVRRRRCEYAYVPREYRVPCNPTPTRQTASTPPTATSPKLAGTPQPIKQKK
jgi:hypothetical protein